jgi:hypothetical protein
LHRWRLLGPASIPVGGDFDELDAHEAHRPIGLRLIDQRLRLLRQELTVGDAIRLALVYVHEMDTHPSHCLT